MNNFNKGRQIRRKNVDYKFIWSFSNKIDFKIWLKQFKSAKKWQRKHIRKDRKGKEFGWFIHNTLRSKKTCEYSKSPYKFCEARIKVPTMGDKDGQFIVELNEDGCEHFLSEFFPTFRKLIVN